VRGESARWISFAEDRAGGTSASVAARLSL
jgi:hypothetical protein